MLQRAMAKINLALDVTGKRPDGYHEVRMIMQSVLMYDRLEMKHNRCNEIRLKTNLSFLPNDERNLVYRAVQMLKEEFRIPDGVDIHLEKFIPVAAGMAGGSTDAAAALVCFNRLFRLGLSKEELMERGAKLGADVPFCIMGGTALAEGIGERLTLLPDMPDCHILIAKPHANVSTKFVYGNLDLGAVHTHPDIEAMIEAIHRGSIGQIAAGLENVLETVTIPAYPEIETIKEIMKCQGADGTLMSGSGSTVFGIFTEMTKAEQAKRTLKKNRLVQRVFLTKPYFGRSD